MWKVMACSQKGEAIFEKNSEEKTTEGENSTCSQSCRHSFTLYLSYKEVQKPWGGIWHFVIRLIMFPAGPSPPNLPHTHATACDCIRFFYFLLSLRVTENWTKRMQKRPERISITCTIMKKQTIHWRKQMLPNGKKTMFCVMDGWD